MVYNQRTLKKHTKIRPQFIKKKKGPIFLTTPPPQGRSKYTLAYINLLEAVVLVLDNSSDDGK